MLSLLNPWCKKIKPEGWSLKRPQVLFFRISGNPISLVGENFTSYTLGVDVENGNQQNQENPTYTFAHGKVGESTLNNRLIHIWYLCKSRRCLTQAKGCSPLAYNCAASLTEKIIAHLFYFVNPTFQNFFEFKTGFEMLSFPFNFYYIQFRNLNLKFCIYVAFVTKLLIF